MKKILLTVALILKLGNISSLVGQENQARIESKIDTLMSYQKMIYSEVKKEDPLATRGAGFEINPARLLVMSDDRLSISGTYSMFAIDRRAEIAFPFLYEQGDKRHGSTRLINLDAQYRRFLGDRQGGLYFSGGLRFTSLKGYEGDDWAWDDVGTTNKVTENKLGVLCGVGYRYFTKSGFFWGTSLSVGRYFKYNDKSIQDNVLDDGKVIVDFEILKFGFAF
ncbi:hypothetical protein L6Q79_14530 [bacterium]|nr:hypothetical protein [bacterium]NUN46455.1 hypothetical protein [bacterium]